MRLIFVCNIVLRFRRSPLPSLRVVDENHSTADWPDGLDYPTVLLKRLASFEADLMQELANLHEFALGLDHQTDFVAFFVFLPQLLFARFVRYTDISMLLEELLQKHIGPFISR